MDERPNTWELLSERQTSDRLADFIHWRKAQLEWQLRSKLKGQRKPRPIIMLTTSRSGSTWLCGVLAQSLRVCRIPEHLRPHHFQAINSQDDPTMVIHELISDTAAHIASFRSGGTKIIWDDIPGIKALFTASAIIEWLEVLNALDPVWIRLTRRDRTDQAVSRFKASNSGVFHHFSSASVFGRMRLHQTQQPIRKVASYDFDGIYRHYEHLSVAEQRLDALISKLPWTVHSLVYEEIKQAPFDPIAGIVAEAAAIPFELALTRVTRTVNDSNLSVTRSKDSELLKQRFSTDLKQRATPH